MHHLFSYQSNIVVLFFFILLGFIVFSSLLFHFDWFYPIKCAYDCLLADSKVWIGRRSKFRFSFAVKMSYDTRKPKHTILLVQYTTFEKTRTYFHYPSVNAAMDAVVKMYEKRLKQLNPEMHHITYSIDHLNQYIDSLGDLSALVFDPAASMYTPCGRDWIKKKVFQVLKNQVN